MEQNDYDKRLSWIKKFIGLKSEFEKNANLFETELKKDIKNCGIASILHHLRLASDIPEIYKHDSTEEKLYSKYTDSLLCETFLYLGLKSYVLKERADAADVDAFGKDFSFVADAKSFRLSRTAKNQKDFKVQAMDGWRRDKDFAMIVCPIYQLPTSNSQIYEQASKRNVCVFTYSHLAILVRYAELTSKPKAESLLFKIFKTVSQLNSSKIAKDYWSAINKSILDYDPLIKKLFKEEYSQIDTSIEIAKKIALNFINEDKEKFNKMTKEEAINELIKEKKIDSKIVTVKGLSINNILEM